MSAPRDQATNTEHDRSIHNAPHGQQTILLDTIGRLGMMILLFVGVVLISFAFLVGRWDGIGEARAEELSRQFRLLNTRVEVVQHEFNKVQARLIDKGIIEEPTPEDE